MVIIETPYSTPNILKMIPRSHGLVGSERSECTLRGGDLRHVLERRGLICVFVVRPLKPGSSLKVSSLGATWLRDSGFMSLGFRASWFSLNLLFSTPRVGSGLAAGDLPGDLYVVSS